MSEVCRSRWDDLSGDGERRAGRERPPENGPRLRKRAFRGGRSRDLSLQEGETLRRPRKVPPNASEASWVAHRMADLRIRSTSCWDLDFTLGAAVEPRTYEAAVRRPQHGHVLDNGGEHSLAVGLLGLWGMPEA